MPALTAYRFRSYQPVGKDSYGFNIYGYVELPTARESWGDFTATPAAPRPDDYLLVPYTHGSDYSGDAVTVSNCRMFLKKFHKDDDGDETVGAPVVSLYGGYSSYGVMVRRDYLESNTEMQELLEHLDGYPVIDEDDWSQVECEAECEGWESWARGDYKRELAKLHPHDEDFIDEIPDDILDVLFDGLVSAGVADWNNEMGNSAYIDVERVAKATPWPFKGMRALRKRLRAERRRTRRQERQIQEMASAVA